MTAAPSTEIIAALTLARYPWRNAYAALASMGLNRLLLRRTPGLRFWKLLGTARGLAFGPWNPRRYGLFSVWDAAAALDAFERASRVMATYRRHTDELWTVRLKPIGWHGAWGGVDPFAGVVAAAARARRRAAGGPDTRDDSTGACARVSGHRLNSTFSILHFEGSPLPADAATAA